MSIQLFLHETDKKEFKRLEVDITTSISNLKSQIYKELKLSHPLSSYKFTYVSFLIDVVSLQEEDKQIKDNDTIKHLEFKNLSTIFILSSVDTRPKRQSRKKKEIKEIEISGDVSGDDISIEQVISLLEKTKNEKQRKHIISEGCKEAAKLLELKSWQSASKETIIAFLKEDDFAAPEVQIWEAVVAWAKRQVKSEKDDYKAVLKDVLPFIRFPVMTSTDIATKVVPIGILEMQETLDLFSYVGASSVKGSTPPIGSSIKKYSTKKKKRTRRKISLWYNFIPNFDFQ